MALGVVLDVLKHSLDNGPGIRTAVLLKGCPLKCWWCQNPESQGRNPFVHYDAERCQGCGACVDACPEWALTLTSDGVVTDPARCKHGSTCALACSSDARTLVGRWMSVDELMTEVEADQPFGDRSGGGVTFSGGEPLLQWGFLLESLSACRKMELHRAVRTSGVAPPDILMRVARDTDLFLYDLKIMNPEVHRRTTGAPLQTVLNNLIRLVHSGARVEIRIPLVPGITDDRSIEMSAAFLAPLPGIEGVRLLPFSESAQEKHRSFNLPWRMRDHVHLAEGSVERWTHCLERHGLTVH